MLLLTKLATEFEKSSLSELGLDRLVLVMMTFWWLLDFHVATV